MAGLIVRCFSFCFLFVTLSNEFKISEFEVYWLTNFLPIKNWMHAKKEFWLSFFF